MTPIRPEKKTPRRDSADRIAAAVIFAGLSILLGLCLLLIGCPKP